jgi:ornithine decarboxylase
MKLVLNVVPDPSRIIFSNPCKSDYSIRFAADAGVRMMSFDNLDELDKIKKFYPNAHLLLRIFASDPTALVHLESKYGASLESTKTLLEHAFILKLTVVGVSFHVGMLGSQ